MLSTREHPQVLIIPKTTSYMQSRLGQILQKTLLNAYNSEEDFI